MNSCRYSGRVGDLQEFVWPEGSENGHRPVVTNHRAPAEKGRKSPDRKIRRRMTVKVIHEDDAFRDPPHLREDSLAVRIRKMMEEQRGHDDVKGSIAEGQVRSIRNNRH